MTADTPSGAQADASGDDAVDRLVEHYRCVAVRMQGLPMYHPALAVEAVAFRAHDGRHVGVMVTPWFMNLTALPSATDRSTWQRGQVARLDFPSGVYEFVVSEAGEFGLVATRSLFPLMHEFSDAAAARAAARAAAETLFEPDPPPAAATPQSAPVISRRKFLRGG
jgi:[NiFe] hydrogenase assembly HybE family chaperone